MAGLGDQQLAELRQRERPSLTDDRQRVGLDAGQPERAHRLVRPPFELAVTGLDQQRKLEERIHAEDPTTVL
jgi:hypothetical protein